MTISHKIVSHCHIQAGCVEKNGQTVFVGQASDLATFLSAVYHSLNIDYRKFFKMDNLSKLGFLASELLLSEFDRNEAHPDTAIIVFSRCSSLDIDTRYQQSIHHDNYFPSPSEFVYTLPNIVTGEIAIRNKIFGETACFIVENPTQEDLFKQVDAVFQDETIVRCLCGRVDYFGELCEAEMWLIER